MELRYDALDADMLTPLTYRSTLVTPTPNLALAAVQAGRLLGVHASVMVSRLRQDGFSITCACRLETAECLKDIQA